MGGRRLRVFFALLAVLAAVTVGPAAESSNAQVQPRIAVDPSCGPGRPVELTVRFSGVAAFHGGEVRIYFDYPRQDEWVASTFADPYDGSYRASAVVTTDRAPDPEIGGYLVAARQPRLPNDPPVTTVFRVPCSGPSPTTTTTRPPPTTTTTIPPPSRFTPALAFNPAVGPPGFATTAVGSGWPPGLVTLGWDAGGGPITAVADADGSFSMTVLVQPGARLGLYDMVGNGAGGATAGGEFLVVPRTMAPPLWVR